MGRFLRFLFESYVVTLFFLFFFFNDTATTEIYTLSLHDALPISGFRRFADFHLRPSWRRHLRSEEHTSELQSRVDISYAVFCLKKKKQTNHYGLVQYCLSHIIAQRPTGAN